MARSASSWVRALTVQERGAPPLPGHPARMHLARRRLERWRSQAPFGDPTLFAQRLALDHLTEADLLAVLAEPLSQLERRLPQSLTAWAEPLVAALSNRSQASAQQRSSAAADAGLVELLEPLIDAAANRLQAGARTVVSSAPGAPFDPEHAPRLLAQLLPARLNPLLVRFADLPPTLRTLKEHPVLARLILQRLDRWVDASLEFLSRLASDATRLQATFSTMPQLGRLVAVEPTVADSHAGGRAPAIVRFSSGTRIVYKPKPLAVDRHFQELLQWAHARGLRPEQWTLTLVDRGAYGWVELVEPQECGSHVEVERFFARTGSLAALLHALGAADFSADNLVAVGEHPILIDVDALLQPRLQARHVADATQRAVVRLHDSVLGVGLLPFRPRNIEVIRRAPSALTGELAPRNAGAHQPSLEGAACEPSRFLEPLLDGFASAYRLLLAHRSELVGDDSPLARFANDVVRVLPRPSSVYARLLSESFQPDLLRDALERDRFLDRLWVGVPQQPHLLAFLAFERADIAQADVPLFITRPASEHVYSAVGERLQLTVEQTGMTVAQLRLRDMSEAHLQRELRFLRAALAVVPESNEVDQPLMV